MLDIVSFIAIPFQALSIFYKPLSDRFGRKIFLVINTLGMSLGMLVIALSHNLALYVVGAVIIFFFVPHDMQVVYVMESAPSKHRAKIYSTVKCIAKKRRISTTLLSCSEDGARECYLIICCTFSFCRQPLQQWLRRRWLTVGKSTVQGCLYCRSADSYLMFPV